MSIQRADFNPLSPCGERPPLTYITQIADLFQSTLPMRGETSIDANLELWVDEFQSTLPMRGETAKIAKNNDINP